MVDKIWLAQYQQGVPYEINPDEITSLAELMEDCCRQYADRVAYVNFGHPMTYRELEMRSRQFGLYLQHLGLKKGARIALMMPNLLQYPVALFGVLRAGYIVVNTNPLYTPDEVVHQINDAGAETILVLENFAHTVERALPRTGLKHVIVTRMGDEMSPLKGLIINAVVKYIKKMIPAWHIPQAVHYREILKHHIGETLNPVTIKPDDTAFLQYTGGTTGVAKAAMLTHRNLVANVLQASCWIAPLNIGTQDIIVTALPLYHIFSLTANCLTFLKVGAKNILITNPRDLKGFIKDIKHSGFTAITGVNTLFNALLNHPQFGDIDFSSLKLALSGGMALQKGVAQRWHEATQKRVLEAYGLTETSPAVTINPMYLEEYNGSIGLPLPSTEISIRDDAGNELGINQPGELCIKGPQVMSSYWQKTEETALVFTKDGFLKTGDVATMDEKGFLYLVDRKKDMIVISGFNVYPNEVEQVISLLPSVLEVGVIGVQHEDGVESIKACIVKRDNALTAEQVIAHCREHLTGYKIPKIIEFFTELPKTNVGKILRRALK